MRFFAAVNMPIEFSHRISDLSDEFKGLMHFKPVKAENMHITLFFFGEQSEPAVKDIKMVMDKITFSPFEILFDEVGFFGSRNFPKVIFIRGHSEYLRKIHQDMQNEFEKLGISFDKKPFSIHLTLLRVKKLYEKDTFLDKINNINKFFHREEVKFDTIHLIKSTLTTEGPEYETVYNKKALC